MGPRADSRFVVQGTEKGSSKRMTDNGVWGQLIMMVCSNGGGGKCLQGGTANEEKKGITCESKEPKRAHPTLKEGIKWEEF